jgi:hypothetical protein
MNNGKFLYQQSTFVDAFCVMFILIALSIVSYIIIVIAAGVIIFLFSYIIVCGLTIEDSVCFYPNSVLLQAKNYQ